MKRAGDLAGLAFCDWDFTDVLGMESSSSALSAEGDLTLSLKFVVNVKRTNIAERGE